MNKNIIIGVVVVLVLIGASFYGGMKYAQGKVSVGAGQFGRTGGGPGGATGAGRFGGRTGNGGFVGGEVLSVDATSITVKLPTGGSKIILTASSTAVMKSASGSLQDIQVGSNISVQGTANSDGSVTAQSIQIRPAGSSARPNGTTRGQ